MKDIYQCDYLRTQKILIKCDYLRIWNILKYDFTKYRKYLYSVTSYRHDNWGLNICGSINNYTENLSN
jgi:hypothetical protein